MSFWCPEKDICLTDSEDEENEFQRDFHGREAILFVVDANLFQHKDRFSQALMIIRGAFLSGLLANDKDLMGIMFANTEHSPMPLEKNCLENISLPPYCAVFLPPRQLTKSIVEHFLNFMVHEVDNFGTKYGIAANGGCGNFSTMLRLCLNLFTYCGYKLNNAAVVYLTDKVTPHPLESREYQWALQKAQALERDDIEFHVIPMVDEFDYDPFYKEFLTLVKNVELDSFIPPDAQQQREQLTNRKLRQDFLKRCLGHFKLSLGPNLDLSVQYYNYFKRRSYPRKVKITCEDNSVVKQKYKIMVCHHSKAQEVKTTGGWHEINVGCQTLKITTEQLNRVRNLHAPGMMLLGFKPKSELPKNMYYKPCNFMYPDDQHIVGSKRLFRALWQRCLAREKIAVCLFMQKRKSIPRYVALVPIQAVGSHSDKSYRSLISGDGFKIVYLPTQHDIRETNFTKWNNIDNAANQESEAFFYQIVKKLRIKYQPQLINDPVLEKLQANLLALALDIKTENNGLTEMPDARLQDERIAKWLPNLEMIFGVDVESKAKKRLREDDAQSAPKIRKLTMDQIKSFDFVEDLIEKKNLNRCTIVQLRFILKNHFGVYEFMNTKQACIDEILTQSDSYES